MPDSNPWIKRNVAKRGASVTKKTTGGNPFAMPRGAGKSTSGVVSSMDPAAMRRAMGGPTRTDTRTQFTGPGGQQMANVQSRVDPAISGTDVSQQILRDVMAQKEATQRGREQVMGQAEAIESVSADAASRMREVSDGYASAEVQRSAEFQGALGRMGDFRERVEQFQAEAGDLREDQIARVEELRLDSLAAIKTPFGIKMNAIIGGMKNQFGNILAEIDSSVQQGKIDSEAAAQMRSQAKMAHLGSVGTYASQLAAQQADTQSRMTSQINQATIIARQHAIDSGMRGEQAALETMRSVLQSETTARAAYDSSVRSYELGLGQLATAIERMEISGVELAAEYRTATAAMPSAEILHPALMLMADLQEEDMRTLMSATQATGAKQGTRRGSALPNVQDLFGPAAGGGAARGGRAPAGGGPDGGPGRGPVGPHGTPAGKDYGPEDSAIGSRLPGKSGRTTDWSFMQQAGT